MGIGAAMIGSSIIGAAGSIIGSGNAAKAQSDASKKAQKILQPYVDLGNKAVSTLSPELADLSKPVSMTQADLENTPGYKFNLAQGLKATQNSAAARGLGSSGAALKGAAAYATGLADSTYQNQFENALANKKWTLNSLMDVIGAGSGSAGKSADVTTGLGNAQGAASIAQGNAIGGLGNGLAAGYLGRNGVGAYNVGSLY